MKKLDVCGWETKLCSVASSSLRMNCYILSLFNMLFFHISAMCVCSMSDVLQCVEAQKELALKYFLKSIRRISNKCTFPWVIIEEFFFCSICFDSSLLCVCVCIWQCWMELTMYAWAIREERTQQTQWAIGLSSQLGIEIEQKMPILTHDNAIAIHATWRCVTGRNSQ